jgi:hypothetical protein
MRELLLNTIPTGKATIPIGKQAVAPISNNILPNNTFGFAYTKGSNTGYVVGGRTNSTASRRIIKIDLTTNELTPDYDLPADLNIDTVSSAMVDNVIYCYAGWAFFKYDTVSRTLTRYPNFTEVPYATTPGQMEGSYNGKIYKCNKVGTNNFNILEYDTVTNTHSIFKNVNGLTNIGLYVASMIVGNMLYITDPQMGSNVCRVNLDTKAVNLSPIPTPLNGTASSLAASSTRLFVFSDTTPVVSLSLNSPYTALPETPLINKRFLTGVFTKDGYMKSYIGTTSGTNDYLSYGIGE